MSFVAGVDAYDRFMGRYSRPLAPLFATFAGVSAADRVLDVGCGSGILTEALLRLVAPSAISAVDPSPEMVSGVRRRFPDLDIKLASAESLPFPEATFDVTLAQLVVHFMTDPAAGIRDMVRVTRPGGAVAACVWDQAGGTGPLSPFWAIAREFDGSLASEPDRPGTRQGHLGELFRDAGLVRVRESLVVKVTHPTFDEWWEPYTLAVGSTGTYIAGLSPAQLETLRQRCQARYPTVPFVVTARAWAVVASVPA